MVRVGVNLSLLSTGQVVVYMWKLTARKQGDVTIWINEGDLESTSVQSSLATNKLTVKYQKPPTVQFSVDSTVINTPELQLNVYLSEPINGSSAESFQRINASLDDCTAVGTSSRKRPHFLKFKRCKGHFHMNGLSSKYLR